MIPTGKSRLRGRLRLARAAPISATSDEVNLRAGLSLSGPSGPRPGTGPRTRGWGPLLLSLQILNLKANSTRKPLPYETSVKIVNMASGGNSQVAETFSSVCSIQGRAASLSRRWHSSSLWARLPPPRARRNAAGRPAWPSTGTKRLTDAFLKSHLPGETHTATEAFRWGRTGRVARIGRRGGVRAQRAARPLRRIPVGGVDA